MTAPSIREAVARAIYERMAAADPKGWAYPWVPGGNSDKQTEARGHAAAALAVVLPVLREHYAAIAESYEPRCDVCPRGVSTAIRADEGPA